MSKSGAKNLFLKKKYVEKTEKHPFKSFVSNQNGFMKLKWNVDYF